MGDAIEIDPLQAGKAREHLLVALADRQEGNLERAQILRLGFTRHQVDHMLSTGLLVPRFRGVYSLGRRKLTRRGMWMAAVLAAGEGAVLSHRSAARLWGLRVGEKEIEVTAANGRKREGIVIHRATLPPDELTTRDGIPTTTAARTLLDLAAVETAQTLERALHYAERERLADATPLATLLDRYPRRPGTPKLRAILTSRSLGDDVTESELEDAFIGLLDRHRLPRPLLNRWLTIGSDHVRADALYPDHRLIVELDGRRDHATTKAFHGDRKRDRRLLALGWQTARFTWRDMEDEHATAQELQALLGR